MVCRKLAVGFFVVQLRPVQVSASIYPACDYFEEEPNASLFGHGRNTLRRERHCCHEVPHELDRYGRRQVTAYRLVLEMN